MNKMVLNYEQLRLWSKCYNLVTEKFKDKVDRGGKPYIEHLEHVAYKFPLFEYMLAGLLHDILEDTDVCSNELRATGVPEEVVEAVILISWIEGVATYDGYLKYIQQVADSGNKIAIFVKLEDLRHNSDTSRLKEKDLKNGNVIQRLKKYKEAIEILENALYKVPPRDKHIKQKA